jgi:hypothetical protein
MSAVLLVMLLGFVVPFILGSDKRGGLLTLSIYYGGWILFMVNHEWLP